MVEKSDSENSENTSEGDYPKRTKRVCLFCETKTIPSYTDSSTLRKFLSDRSRILPRIRTGACSKHQRKITREIKHARHLALLPFVARV